jgi:deoxyribonuclease IV
VKTDGLWHPYLGAHMSIAGGLHLALEEAARHRCGAVQLFTRNANQWAAKPLTSEVVRVFEETNARLGPFEMAAHDSYLINLGSPDSSLRARSLQAFIDEIERCEALSVPRLVFHPGAHMGEGEEAGLRRVGACLRQALLATSGCSTRLMIENTAGQGSSLGYSFLHLEQLLDLTSAPDRLGICLDTCHLLAAGHEFRDPTSYAALRQEISRRVGLDRVGWFHLNDSKVGLGRRVDRHTHIGRGEVGSRPFRFFLTDPVFRSVPMVLETPKEDEADRRNLSLLRRLSRIPK